MTEHKKKKKTGANDVLERGMGDVTGITTNDMRSGMDSLRGSVIPMKFLLATIEKNRLNAGGQVTHPEVGHYCS